MREAAAVLLSDLAGRLPDLLLWGLIATAAMTTILQGAQGSACRG